MKYHLLSVLILAVISMPAWSAEPAIASNSGLKAADCQKMKDGKQIRDAMYAIKNGTHEIASAHADAFTEAAKTAAIHEGANILEQATADCAAVFGQGEQLIETCHRACSQLPEDPQAQKNLCMEASEDVKNNMSINKVSCTMQAENSRKTSYASGSGMSQETKDNLIGAGVTAATTGGMIAAMTAMQDDGGGGGGSSTPSDPCAGKNAGNNSKCTDQLLVACSNNPSDTRCGVFNSTYCKAGGANESSGYCGALKVADFCDSTKNPGNGVCPACIQRQAATSPACSTSPTACLGQNSPEQIAVALQQCPGEDPIYGKAATGTALVANAGAGVATGASTVAVTGGGGGSMAVASVIGGGTAIPAANLPADVVGAYGPNLFSLSSTTINDRRAKRQIGH